MRRPERQGQGGDATSKDGRSSHGPYRRVKVVPVGKPPRLAREGYTTLAKSIYGKTPEQIEKALDLPFRCLKHGAVIHSLKHLPSYAEPECELTAAHPGGAIQTPASNPDFSPGSKVLHRSQTEEGLRSPIVSESEVRLPPGQPYRG